MPTQHVEAKEHVHRLIFENGKRARQHGPFDVDERHMDAPDDARRPDAARNALPAPIDEAIQVAALGKRLAHCKYEERQGEAGPNARQSTH